MAFKPSRKVGIKLLDKKQLRNAFPQYDNLQKNIQFQRERAKPNETNRDAKRLLENGYYLMHDNVYGIFGGRGSGKTSVLYSLRETLLGEGHKYGDIILPIIIPEIINRECSLLGWTLAIFDDVIEEIERQVNNYSRLFDSKELMYKTKIDFFENCRFNAQNNLREEYNLIYKECFSSTDKINTQHSYADTINIKADESKRQYKLLKNLNKFWNLLVNTKHQLNIFKINSENKYQQSSEHLPSPLIFIMFDDIDLAPERSTELLSSAFKYFSNPNIVIIISAAMKTLENGLRYKMFEKVVGSHFPSIMRDSISILPNVYNNSSPNKKVLEFNQMEEAQKAALEYLNKVIPPSSRYFLEKYDTSEQKILFCYSAEFTEYEYKPDNITSKPILEFLNDLIKDFETPNNHNFLLKDKNRPLEPKNFITAYLMILGNKNRNIFNGCIEIMSALETLKKIKNRLNERKSDCYCNMDDYHEIYYIIHHLLTVLITSNVPSIQEYKEDISNFLLLHKGEWNLYVNYALLLEMYERKSITKQREIEEKYNNPNPANVNINLRNDYLINEEMRDRLSATKHSISILFITLFFIENLLQVMVPDRKHIHGYWEIIEFLNKDNIKPGPYKIAQQMKLFQSEKSVRTIITTYASVLEDPRPYMLLDIFNLSDINTYLTSIYSDDLQKNELKADKLAISCETDYYWCKTMLALLFISQSDLTFVDKNYYIKYHNFLKPFAWWKFGEDLNVRANLAFTEFLNQSHILTYSVNKICRIIEILLNENTPIKSHILDFQKKTDLEFLFKELNLYDSKEILLQNQLIKLWEQFETMPLPQEIADSKETLLKNQLIKFWDQYKTEHLPQEMTETKGTLLQNQLIKLWEQYKPVHFLQEIAENRNFQVFSHKIILFYDYIIERIRKEFIHLVVIIDSSKQDEVIEWIDKLTELSPGIHELGETILREYFFRNAIKEKEQIILPFTVFFQLISAVMTSLDSVSKSYREPYISFLPNFIENCPIYESPLSETDVPQEEGSNNIFELVVNLHLLNYLVPYYFAAQFIIAGQSNSAKIRYQSEQSNHTQDSFTEIYQEITDYIEKPENLFHILSQTFRQVKEDVISDYLQKIEAPYE